MSGWKVVEVKGYRPFVKLIGKDCVCGQVRAFIPDTKYPGSWKLVLSSPADVDFEIRCGFVLSQYCEAHLPELIGAIVTIGVSGKKGQLLTYQVGYWLGDMESFRAAKNNTGVIARTDKHIKTAMEGVK